MERLDNYEKIPPEMRNYLNKYGWHFSKKMCDWAVSRMIVENKSTGKKEHHTPMERDTVDEIMKKYGVTLENSKGYDHVYVANMAHADYYKSSIADEAHLAMFVKDYLDDPDGYDGIAFTRFYADCIGSGTPIIWDDML